MEIKKKYIVLGFNGDRDSQLTGILLSKQGYSVTGVYYYINPEKIFNIPSSIISKFTREKDLVLSKANEIAIDLTVVDVTNYFIDEVLDSVISSRISFTYVNYCQLISKFLINRLSEDFESIATGHYVKLLKHTSSVQILMHSDSSLDQSYLFSDMNLAKLDGLISPLGDLALREREKLVKDYRVSNIESKDLNFLSFSDFVPESLIKRIEFNSEVFKNTEFELSNFSQDVDTTFILEGDSLKYIETKIYECSLSTLKPEPLSRNLFVRVSNSVEYHSVLLTFYTLNRFRIEFIEDLDLSLYVGQIVNIYDSDHRNSRLLGSGRVFKPNR